MTLFFDTCALVKFFHLEEGSDKVTELINSEANEIWILDIAGLELSCSFFRRFRNKEIDEIELEMAIRSFQEQSKSFNIEYLGDHIIDEAHSLLMKYGKNQGLRTLDALHLGAFSFISNPDWVFVTSDRNLYNISKMIGFNSLNPMD